MYGYEESTGLGGLAAQAPANPYMARAMAIRNPGAMIVGDETVFVGGGTAPQFLVGGVPRGGPPQVSWGGGAVEQPAERQMGNWRDILDFHNSPAPWVLIMILIIYGYVHVSYRRGRVSAGGGL